MALTPFFLIGRDQSIFDPLDKFLEPFDRFPLWNNAASLQFSEDVSPIVSTRVDWLETPEAHIFKADLPGLKKEEVKVQLEDGVRTLQISAERKKEEVEQTDKWHRVERTQGSFLRRFKLPENAKVEEVKAKVEDGVLTVTVPKIAKPHHEVKAIEISG